MPDLPAANSRRFYVLDGIRGIAALLVVLRHTGEYFNPITFQESYLAVDFFSPKRCGGLLCL
jgi:peptidoglycan/LPS O-acetylase OafA/YrhL